MYTSSPLVRKVLAWAVFSISSCLVNCLLKWMPFFLAGRWVVTGEGHLEMMGQSLGRQ